MISPDLISLWVTFKLAVTSTLILVVLGLPLAWWLARTSWRGRFVIEALVALPIVLPPTVLGFYLLSAMSETGLPGMRGLAFSFSGIVVGSVLYSLPFVVQPMVSAFRLLSDELLESAAVLGANAWRRFIWVALPGARGGVVTAAALGFAHTVGEFGVVLMLGGNLPGETQTASVRIYELVEQIDFDAAGRLSLTLLAVSVVLILVIYGVSQSRTRGRL